MVKRALVVSGGGSKGAFAVGAIEVLREHGLEFELIAGTSTGALIATLVAAGELALLREVYTTVETEDVIVERSGLEMLSGDGLFDSRPLWQLINRHLDDARYARVLASAADVFVCATNLQDARTYYFNPRRGQDGTPLSRDTFARAILASSSQPVLMPAVRVPRDGDQFVDGGVREVAPISKAMREGAEEIYAIVLSPEASTRKQTAYRCVSDTLVRALDILLEEVVRDDVAAPRLHNQLIEYMARVQQRARQYVPAERMEEVFAAGPELKALFAQKLVKLHVIRPQTELPGDGLSFDPKRMRAALELGRAAAEQCLRDEAAAQVA